MTTARDHSEFLIPGMRCAACIAKIEGGLQKAPGVSRARVNLTTKRLSVDHDAAMEPGDIKALLDRLGFSAELSANAGAVADRTESRKLLKALGVAGFAAMNIMLLSVSVWSGAEGPTRQMFHWLSALIAMPTVAYAGRPFFRSAWTALRRARTNMDVPISIGILIATALSLYETIIGGPHAYFDGAVSLIFFLLAGRYLDSAMRDRARDGAANLLRQTVQGGMVQGADGAVTWRAANEIDPGMLLSVGMGERFAADGRVEQGTSAVDRSLVTGETALEAVSPGDPVLAGTLNVDGPLMIRVTAAGPDTTIAEMARLMETAGQGRSHYVRVADRAARLYAPAVHSLAAMSFIGWMLAGAGWHQALLIAVAVLIITCPCALGLAVPVAQVVAAGSLMRRGILIKDGSALERLAEVDTVRFDKTGTLTLGRMVFEGPLSLNPQEAAIALGLAQASRHPLAHAVAQMLQERNVQPVGLSGVRECPGFGVEGVWQGKRVRLGRPDWVASQLPGSAGAATAFGVEGEGAHLLAFRDALRPDAAQAVGRLAAAGMEVAILSGDREQAVRSVASALGLPALAELSPADKVARIEQSRGEGKRVLMVGDGLNDGPALAAGTVSMAPASASDVGQTAADLLFLGDSLLPVPIALMAARRTMRVVRQNFVLAIGYNILAVPLAILGLVTPLVAAVAMSTSSILVVANALRLRTCAR